MTHNETATMAAEEAHEHHSEHATSAHHEHEAIFPSEVESEQSSSSDLTSKVATIAVVGVGVALISAELIPGMLIGVAAALLPGMGSKMKPLFKSTVKAGYSAVKKTQEMMAEASEQFKDVIAEAKSDHSNPVPPPPPAAPKA